MSDTTNPELSKSTIPQIHKGPQLDSADWVYWVTQNSLQKECEALIADTQRTQKYDETQIHLEIVMYLGICRRKKDDTKMLSTRILPWHSVIRAFHETLTLQGPSQLDSVHHNLLVPFLTTVLQNLPLQWGIISSIVDPFSYGFTSK